MLVDLLDTANNISVNIDLIKIIGLENAAYCSSLITIYRKAHKKNKMVDGDYFKLDRTYIKDTLNIEKKNQLEIDKMLSKLNILSINKVDKDLIKVDIDRIAGMLSAGSEELERISKVVTASLKTEKKKTKDEAIRDNMRAEFENCPDEDLRNAFYDWVDAVLARRFLTKSIVKDFKDGICNYTEDVDVAIAVIRVATLQGWSDVRWAINSYEKTLRMNKGKGLKKLKSTVNAVEETATEEDIDYSEAY